MDTTFDREKKMYTHSVSRPTATDAKEAAEETAANLRASGKLVTFGAPYEVVAASSKYGWTAIDLTVEDASAPTTQTVVESVTLTAASYDPSEDAWPISDERGEEPAEHPSGEEGDTPADPKAGESEQDQSGSDEQDVDTGHEAPPSKPSTSKSQAKKKKRGR